MCKIIGTCAAAFICGSLALIPGRTSQVDSGIASAAVKADRLDIAARATGCSQFARPYYDSTCLYDGRRPGGEAREVRLVSTDQLRPRDQNVE
jgi:hypothetical protein